MHARMSDLLEGIPPSLMTWLRSSMKVDRPTDTVSLL